MLTSETEFNGQTFKGLTALDQELIRTSFEQCVFVNCTFREVIFQACEFHDCRFEQCELSLARVPDSLFINTSFHDCQLIGLNWSEARWGRRFLKPFDFVNCVLNYATFLGVNLKEVALTDCIAREVDFSEANLTEADCRDTDFNGSRFQRTDLTQADFTGATNYTIAAGQNTLKGTKFSLPEAMALLYSLDIVLTE